MSSSVGGSIEFHDRLSKPNAFLFMLVVVLFSDTFLTYRFGASLYLVDYEWYEKSLNIGDFMLYALLFSFYFGVFIPFLLAFIDARITASKRVVSMGDNYIRLYRLRLDSIVENNQVSYLAYENKVDELNKLEATKKLMLASVVLLLAQIFNYFFSGLDSGFIVSCCIEKVKQEGVVPLFLRLLLLGISFWFYYGLTSATDTYTNTIYIDDYHKRLEPQWLKELEIGLLDRQELLNHLKNVINDNSHHRFSNGSREYDHQNKSHKYCKRYSLILNDGSLSLSKKGEFYSKYC
ncbi:hypothetical protein [Cellvibrio mixtus]|uniref:hypothetical protein n=1 Tax=Cellvibrio mixtus TaxID=39650 RepID=UPI000586CAC5|nr:hypothetical protein [Cellvibrio mixtus]